MKNEKLFNIPNVLSAYRIFILPLIIWSIFSGNKQLYIVLMSINLVTDILDGAIARAFKLETEFGARLDSLADIGTYLMAFIGIIVLENEFVRAHYFALSLIIVFYATPQLISLIRFGRTTSFHLYSSKILGYVQGIFLFSFFVWGYVPWYFYFMAGLSCIVYSESLFIVLTIPQLQSNVKGIYYMVKKNKRIA